MRLCRTKTVLELLVFSIIFIQMILVLRVFLKQSKRIDELIMLGSGDSTKTWKLIINIQVFTFSNIVLVETDKNHEVEQLKLFQNQAAVD